MGPHKCFALRQLLHTITPKKLLLLDDENVDWLPRLRNIHPADVVQSIILAVRASETEADRLQRTAWIRCWLMPFDDQRTWKFYRVTEIPTLHGCNEALNRITSALKRFTEDGSEPYHAWIVRGSAVYACMLAKITVNEAEEPKVIYVAMWTTQPLFAVSYLKKIHWCIQEVVQLAIRSDVFKIGEIRASPEMAFKTALSTLRTVEKVAALAKGKRYHTANQQPQESLAVGSHGEQVPSVPGFTADAEQFASKQPANFSCPECWEDFNSQQDQERHYSHVHLGKMKKQHFCSYCPYWNFTRSTLETHIQSHRADGSSSSKVSSTQPAIETALNEESAFRPMHTCRPCGECFPTGPLLLRHQEHCSSIQQISCQYCGLLVPDKSTLDNHVLLHTT
ncbi:hypothetical protein V5799_028752 [Amblyomma americanum]|uniref:C2H2-type domain-containing protein n=1 Tax=Amblyomma americanum TaxID=6943 RepID=A0AAQ4DBZ1_AMBAM